MTALPALNNSSQEWRLVLAPVADQPVALITGSASRVWTLRRTLGPAWPAVEILPLTSLDDLREAIEVRRSRREPFFGAVLLDRLVAGTPTVQATRLMLESAMHANPGFPQIPVVALVPDVGAGIMALKEGAVDCVLPCDAPARWTIALTFARLRADATHTEPLRNGKGEHGPFVMVSEGRHAHRVMLEHVRLVEAEGNYVRLVTPAERHLLRATLTEMEAQLAPLGFLRVHRSCLINLSLVRSVEHARTGETSVVLACGRRVRVSRRLRAALTHALTKLSWEQIYLKDVG